MKSALLVMDMQYDFCESGPMAHEGSLAIIPLINRLRDNYDYVIFIVKQLQFNHSIFEKYGGLYPEHCVKGTNGIRIHDDLIVKTDDIIINRGTLQKYDSNSAFYNADAIGKPSRLKQILLAYNIQNLYFCGNGLDNVIYSTIIDAINNKYKCYIIENAVTYLNEEKIEKCLNYLGTLDVDTVKALC